MIALASSAAPSTSRQPIQDCAADGDHLRIAAQPSTVAVGGGHSTPDAHELNAAADGQRPIVTQPTVAVGGGPTSIAAQFPSAAADGHTSADTQQSCADGGGHAPCGARSSNATAVGDPHPEIEPALAALTVLCRHRGSLLRLEKSAHLAALSTCRVYTGDKAAARALLKQISEGKAEGLAADLVADHIAAGQNLRLARLARQRQIVKVVETIPVWREWGAGVRGVAALGFGLMLAECHDVLGGPMETRTVAQVWKRFGLAVIRGGRQRLVAGDPEVAAEHGFSPVRRSISWSAGEALVKQGREYRAFYLATKAALVEREAGADPARAAMWFHVQARRRMEKRFLRDLWRAWRRWRRGLPINTEEVQ